MIFQRKLATVIAERVYLLKGSLEEIQDTTIIGVDHPIPFVRDLFIPFGQAYNAKKLTG